MFCATIPESQGLDSLVLSIFAVLFILSGLLGGGLVKHKKRLVVAFVLDSVCSGRALQVFGVTGAHSNPGPGPNACCCLGTRTAN